MQVPGYTLPLFSHPPSLTHSSLVAPSQHAVVVIPLHIAVLPHWRKSGDPDTCVVPGVALSPHTEIQTVSHVRSAYYRTAWSGTSVNKRSSAADAFIGEVRTAQGRRALAVDWPLHGLSCILIATHASTPRTICYGWHSCPTGLRSSQKNRRARGRSVNIVSH
jgi:hypothetical protein